MVRSRVLSQLAVLLLLPLRTPGFLLDLAVPACEQVGGFEPPGGGGVEGQVGVPLVEDRHDELLCLLHLVATHELGGVAVDHVEQQGLVGLGFGHLERLFVAETGLDRGEAHV